MIDIKTLRFEVQLNKLDNSQMVLSPLVVGELLDRLEAAEAEALEEARLNGMGGEREAALMAKLEAAEKERDAPGAQPALSVPSVEAAELMGAKGGSAVDAERLAFEAWMRGHCWKLGAKWTGTEYRSAFEKDGMVDMHAMRTRELWAAWRDRAALAASPEAKP